MKEKLGFPLLMLLTLLGISIILFAEPSANDPTRYQGKDIYQQIEALKVHAAKTNMDALNMAFTAGYVQGQLECNKKEVHE